MLGHRGRTSAHRIAGFDRAWRGFARTLVVLAVVVVSAPASPAPAGPYSAVTRLTGDSGPVAYPALSADASVVAYQEYVSSGSVSRSDIVVRDLVTGEVTTVTVGTGGTAADGDSTSVDVSGDGRLVVFESSAANLIGGDTNSAHDVFAYDRQSGELTLVSADTAGESGDGDSYAPSVSADGRFVAFVSNATDLVPGHSGGFDDVFVRDLSSGETTLVSVGVGGALATGNSSAPSISADGAFVAYASAAGNLVSGDTNGQFDIFRASRSGSGTVRVSVSATGGQLSLASSAPSIDGDGSRVAFESLSDGVVAGDSNGLRDVFVRDLSAGTVRRISVDANGADANGESRSPVLRVSGDSVSFVSVASDLVGDDANESADVFISSVSTPQPARLSSVAAGRAGNGASSGPALCGDGGAVAFHSEASDLVGGDYNGRSDLFVARFGARTYERVAGRDRYTTAVEVSKRAFPLGAGSVVLATGRNWPDALGGSALAGVVGGPLLLTEPERLTPATRAEIERLGATNVHVLGGVASVSSAVEAELKTMLGAASVKRIGGRDRYETGAAVAAEVVRLQGAAFSGEVLVATGGNFPDALAGAPLAAAYGRPIVLVNPASGSFALPAGTTGATILGGPVSVRSSVQSKLIASLGAGNVRRISGADRYEAASNIAQWGVEDLGQSWNGVSVATGETFPDALTGGVMAARSGSVIVLSRSAVLSPQPASRLRIAAGSIGAVRIVGGPVSVSEAVYSSVKKALGD